MLSWWYSIISISFCYWHLQLYIWSILLYRRFTYSRWVQIAVMFWICSLLQTTNTCSHKGFRQLIQCQHLIDPPLFTVLFWWEVRKITALVVPPLESNISVRSAADPISLEVLTIPWSVRNTRQQETQLLCGILLALSCCEWASSCEPANWHL